jgi:hypothetical protein
MNMERIHTLDIDNWTPHLAPERSEALCRELERGAVLFLPRMPFELRPSEQRFLAPEWADPGTKNISLRAGAGEVRGAHGGAADLAELHGMLARYASMTSAFLDRVAGRYSGSRETGATSFRPCSVEGRALSWRRDDARMHVDSFPSNPVRGKRILRVFSNVHPGAAPRDWLIGEPFAQFANRFVPRARRPLPGSAWMLEKLGITKARRSLYDHYMLQLHDAAKGDAEFQRSAPRLAFSFPPRSTWIVFTDQVVHAATAGQFAFEQTFYVAGDAMVERASAPLAILEQLVGRALV